MHPHQPCWISSALYFVNHACGMCVFALQQTTCCLHCPMLSCHGYLCYLQQQLPSDKQSKEQWWYPFAKIGCGAAAGIAAQTASYPLDTLRRRLQVLLLVYSQTPIRSQRCECRMHMWHPGWPATVGIGFT